MISKTKLIVAGILFLLASVVLNQAVSAAVPDALLPAGTTRYATLHSEDYFQTIVGGSWVDVNHSTKYITVPGGQTADVMIIACVELRLNNFP